MKGLTPLGLILLILGLLLLVLVPMVSPASGAIVNVF
jgi:hypothetical protein